MSGHPKFSVIIPSRNAHNLKACAGAIRAHEPDPLRIIVVDDGLPQRVPGCDYIAGAKPFVYARNINRGIAAAGRDDVLLLNDDAQLLTPEGFTRLSLVTQPPYGIVSAVSDEVGNLNQLPRPGDQVRPERRMLCFVAVYLPRTTVDRVGLLDERFVGYGYDDDDYSLRVRQCGLQLGVFDGCVLNHSHLPSTYRDAKTPVNLLPNAALFQQKWGFRA